MDRREAELLEDVAAEVRAGLGAAAPAWRRARVRFEWREGCFSTRITHDDRPLDAQRHRALFVRLQAIGHQLCGPRGRPAACEVEVDPRSHRALRA